jgi:hypothetical protein
MLDKTLLTAGDGLLSTVEGKPAHGEIQVSLTTEGDVGPDSALAVERIPVASASGEVSYERTFDLTRIDGDSPLEDVVIVQHGIDTISPNGESEPPPPVSSLNPDLPLETTAPVNCGAVLATSASASAQDRADAERRCADRRGRDGGRRERRAADPRRDGLLAAGAVTVRRRAVAASG